LGVNGVLSVTSFNKTKGAIMDGVAGNFWLRA
jgi:hypothetical protein